MMRGTLFGRTLVAVGVAITLVFSGPAIAETDSDGDATSLEEPTPTGEEMSSEAPQSGDEDAETPVTPGDAECQITGSVSIAGTPKVGEALSVQGVWTPEGVSVSYQWLRGATEINKAVGSTYTLTLADAGKTISVRVTGQLNGYESRTLSSSVAVPLAKMTVTAPKISGTYHVGDTVTAKQGAWGTDVSYTYQWQRNGKAIKGATKAKYTVSKQDAGTKLTVKVTGKGSGYEGASKISAAKSVPLMLTTKTPSITGSYKVGGTVKVKTGTWGPKGVKLTYQWNRNGKAIKGATKSTYKVVKADAGKKLTVSVRGAKSGYSTKVKTSAVKKVPKLLSAKTPIIKGTRSVGNTLKAKPGSWGTANIKFTYQWKRNGKAIKGATKSSYTLTAADKGKRITVKVTGKKSGYTSQAKTSVKTVAIRPTPPMVYGTLRKGQEAEFVVKGTYKSKQIAKAPSLELWVTSNSSIRDAWPWAVPGTQGLKGEVLTFSSSKYSSMMTKLDKWEGYVPGRSPNSMNYQRKMVSTDKGKVYVYVATPWRQTFAKNYGVRVLSGDFTRY